MKMFSPGFVAAGVSWRGCRCVGHGSPGGGLGVIGGKGGESCSEVGGVLGCPAECLVGR